MAGGQISQGKACNLHPIYPPHLLLHLPGDYWALDLFASSPRCSCLYAVSVRRAGTLPTASFKFRLTTDTLAVQLTVPITRACRELAPPSYLLNTTFNQAVYIHCTPCLAYHKIGATLATGLPLFCLPWSYST